MVHSQDFYNQYQSLYTHYRDIYGPRVAVFLQKGSFWEFYGQQDPETHAQLNSVKEFTDILGVQVNYYPGDAPGGLTGLFAGVPEDRLDKWAGRLTGLGWTVVVATQEKNDKGDVIRRSVSRILSPATHVEAMDGSAGAAYVGAWHPASGCAVTIDVASGTISYSAYKGSAAHFFQVYPPRELVVYGSTDMDSVAKELYLKEDTVLYNRPALPAHLQRPVARMTYMEGIFKPKTIIPFASWLDIQSESAQETLACLLHWIEDHYSNLIVYLPKPTPWHPHDKMRIINNALHQLSMLGPNGVERLFSRPHSPPGIRALPTLLSTPLADAAAIRDRHEKVKWLGTAPTKPTILKALRQLYDFPRIHRAIARGALKAAAVYQLHISYSALKDLAEATATGPFQGYTIGIAVAQCLKHLNTIFDREKSLKAQESPADWGFLSEAVGPRTAAVELDIQRIHVEAHEWLAGMCLGAGLDAQALSYRATDKMTYVVHGTKANLKRIDEWGKRVRENNPYRGVSVSFQKSGGKLEHPMLDTYNERLDAKQAALARTFQHELTAACITYMEATAEHWPVLESWVAHLDCMYAFAATADAQGWNFPTVQDGAAGAVSVRGLRHPLIQAQALRSQLVSHDLDLGNKEGQHYNGMLLYGINASGKSSLMKALGLSVLLAQLGSAVPAQSMTLTPYSAISTRILNQDNLWAGLSSFAVEMGELRTILTAADQRTLVLGDELCSGTESVSATALVAAGIQCLLGAGSSFILATHLHDLMKLPAITEAEALRIAHLRVHYDAVADVLVYDRTLSAGAGASNYGLTVAKALHMPPSLLEAAYGFRRTLLGEDPRAGNSYNADVLQRACEVCGSALARDIEVHHIQEQHDAVKKTWNADGTALHGLRNLVAVCQRCHDAHHAGAITIGMVKDTSAGAQREVVEHRVPVKQHTHVPTSVLYSQNLCESSSGSQTLDQTLETPGTQTSVLGFTSDQILNIQKVHAMYPKLTSKLLAFQIKELHDIDITPTQIASLKKKKVL
jgi:DNA mismatch repair protein MutS